MNSFISKKITGVQSLIFGDELILPYTFTNGISVFSPATQHRPVCGLSGVTELNQSTSGIVAVQQTKQQHPNNQLLIKNERNSSQS